MGIDRIGKNGPSLPGPEVGGLAGSRSSGAVFEVPAATATAPAPKLDPAHRASQGELEGSSGSPRTGLVEPSQAVRGPLERLRAGELDLPGYVDAKVHEATAHLSALPPVELENIRAALRERLAGDPTLIDLLHTATGETLPPLDD